MAIFVSSPDTFLVEEIPAYLPIGVGFHTYAWVEKRDLTTLEAIHRLARLLNINARDIGYAGMKDRHATTRQWLSLPDIDPQTLLTVTTNDMRVLEAKRHQNKLRIGHLWGNRFEVLLTDIAPVEDQKLHNSMLEFSTNGIPNRYGHQRFGAQGDNVQVGLQILRGTRREADGRRRKLFISAVQSAVFNRVLELRALDGGLLQVREGDILERTESGGKFICTDPLLDQVRVQSGELVPTAPLPGNRLLSPPAGTPAAMLEECALAELGIALADLEPLGRALPGTRRPVVVKVTLGVPPLEKEPAGVRLRFSLPAGSYATVLLAALGVEQRWPGGPMLLSDREPAN